MTETLVVQDAEAHVDEFESAGQSPGPRRRASARVPLLPAVEIKILREKYLDALICTRCAQLLATRRESYTRSGRDTGGNPCPLPEADRLAYVCAECRLELAKRERIAALRAEIGRQNIAAARAARARKREETEADEAACGDVAGSMQMGFASPRQSGQFGQVDMTVESVRHVGGRPRKHRSVRAAQAAASRAYRSRARSASFLP